MSGASDDNLRKVDFSQFVWYFRKLLDPSMDCDLFQPLLQEPLHERTRAVPGLSAKCSDDDPAFILASPPEKYINK